MGCCCWKIEIKKFTSPKKKRKRDREKLQFSFLRTNKRPSERDAHTLADSDVLRRGDECGARALAATSWAGLLLAAAQASRVREIAGGGRSSSRREVVVVGSLVKSRTK